MYLLWISMPDFLIPGAMSVIPARLAQKIISFENAVMIICIAVRLASSPVYILSHLMRLVPYISTCMENNLNEGLYVSSWKEE